MNLVLDSTFAIICWKNKILLFLRDNIPTILAPNCWTLPGGRVEKGETPLQGLKRELLEEVSYVPEMISYWGKFKLDSVYTYMYYSFVDYDEAMEFKHGGTEGQKIAFYTLDEMEKIILAPNLKKRLDLQKDLLKKALKRKSFEGFSV